MKPFLDGKNSAGNPSTSLPPLPEGGLAMARRLHPTIKSPGGSHAIDVVKEGDKVVRLIVTCSCGERMEIECIYPAG